jgi:hypothetical protein
MDDVVAGDRRPAEAAEQVGEVEIEARHPAAAAAIVEGQDEQAQFGELMRRPSRAAGWPAARG